MIGLVVRVGFGAERVTLSVRSISLFARLTWILSEMALKWNGSYQYVWSFSTHDVWCMRTKAVHLDIHCLGWLMLVLQRL